MFSDFNEVRKVYIDYCLTLISQVIAKNNAGMHTKKLIICMLAIHYIGAT